MKVSHGLKTAFAGLVICIWGAGIAYAYPKAEITNNTEYSISGDVEYVSAFCSDETYSVAPGKTWVSPDDRGVCLISAITGTTADNAKNGENNAITSYASSGTSYAKFQINAYGGQYRIFSNNEFASVSKGSGKGPGFKFVNKTSWPVAYSLAQLGCLHHGVIQASKDGVDGVDLVNTGSFWLTVRVHIQPDGKDPVERPSDCFDEFSENFDKGLEASFLSFGKGIIDSGIGIKDSATEYSIKESFELAEDRILEYTDEEWKNYIIEAGMAGLRGQFSGYEWPFRCDEMPEYHITGGPEILKSGGKLYFYEGDPFTLEKVNTCGDDMMTASPKSVSIDPTKPFEDLSAAMTVRVMEVDKARKSDAPVNLPKSGLVKASGYYWFLNGDGTRNWLESGPPCAADATDVSRADIDTVHKRHGGEGGYTLKAASFSNVCANTSGETSAKLVTDGSYYWLINADGTRNWIRSLSDDCKTLTKPVDGNISDYPKRAGGVNEDGYELVGEDIAFVCGAKFKFEKQAFKPTTQ